MLMKVKDRRTIKEKRRRRDGGTKRARERESRGRGEWEIETVPGDGWRERGFHINFTLNLQGRVLNYSFSRYPTQHSIVEILIRIYFNFSVHSFYDLEIS